MQSLDHVGIAAAWHKTDVLAVLLVGDRKPEAARQFAGLGFAAIAEREAQQIELRARGGKQEIALVALGLAGAVKRAPAVGQATRGDVMAGRQYCGAELARGHQEIAEFDCLIALDAWDRRFAGHIACRKAINHRFFEPLLVVEHVMGNADPRGHCAGIVNVAAGAAGPFAVGCRAMVVELQGDADDVIALLGQQRRGHRRIHPARHRHHHPRLRGRSFEVKGVQGQRSRHRCRQILSVDKSWT